MLELNFSPFPELQTERLLLKQIVDRDATALFQMRSSPEVMKYIGRPLAKTLDDALALIKVITDAIQNNEGISWGIFRKDKLDELIGTIGFWRVQKEHYRAEIGYLLHPLQQGKGIMLEAMVKALDFGFRSLMFHSVEANVSPGNQPSRRLLQKLGFVQEAYFKENYYSNGTFVDSVIYSLLTPLRKNSMQTEK